jgi:hypothetical protein
MYREPLVSPLRDFICVLNAFLWATLSRASGTLDNTKLERHQHALLAEGRQKR